MPRCSRQIFVGSVAVGGGAPVSVQTMAKAPPTDLEAIVSQLLEARRAGCDIARVALPQVKDAASIREIKERTGLPIVADVHFDWRIAVAAARSGADALRINPGNLGGSEALRRVVEAAGEAGISIRVGVNAGSLPKPSGQPASQTAANLVGAALRMVEDVQGLGFSSLKVSLKAFDVSTTVAANRLFAEKSDLPLHLGLTEAGPPLSGAVRSAAALGILLQEGIGDTIRISLSAPPVEEVRAACVLLRALGLRRGPVVVSCPTCGRTSSEVSSLAARVERFLEESQFPIVVAVMGCEVNGPGEAREADLGVAFGPRGEGLLFENGAPRQKHPNRLLAEVLMDRLRNKLAEAGNGGKSKSGI